MRKPSLHICENKAQMSCTVIAADRRFCFPTKIVLSVYFKNRKLLAYNRLSLLDRLVCVVLGSTSKTGLLMMCLILRKNNSLQCIIL